jgi:hypothetical protein
MPFWQVCCSARSVAVMPDSDELARMMIEISAGWEWGDPRSEVLQTPEHEAKWGRLKVQMKEIADKGGIVDIPSGFPDLTDHRERWPQPPRDTDDSKKRAVTRPSRPHVPEKPKKVSKPGPDRIERTYLAKKGRGGTSVLYMMEEGSDSLRDFVLRESGWVRTSTLADWRFGERSDIDEISQKEAKRFAESVNLGWLVK